MNPFDTLVAHTHLRRSRYRDQLEHMAPALQARWRSEAPIEFPGIALSATCFMRAAEGLLAFFDATRHSGARCALPSQAADSVWHAWLRWDADDLAHYCRRHFQGEVPHLTALEVGPGALARTLVACRVLEGMPAHGLDLPGLFRLDARLRIPNGQGYWLAGGDIVHGRLGDNGKPLEAAKHPELTLSALLAANLISQDMYRDGLERQRDRPHSQSGFLVPDSAQCAAGGCGDGSGGDSGAGSGCGGGCGGGY